ncbi:MAG: Fe-S cluster assembly protein SufD [Fidelibacterota bacterium]|nr:MAG: Fe-S cluster assembly protein SufD [Candidatus Neomarinimicrobiota bacterium]
MTETTAINDFYRTTFEQCGQEGFLDQPEAVRQMRHSAMDRFVQLGFPTTRMEAWRNTSVEPVAALEFHLPVEASPIDPRTIEPFSLRDSFQAMVAGGRLVPDQLPHDGLPQGVVIRGLADALKRIPEQVLPHLGRYADFNEQAFVALNTAFLSDGVFIQVPEGTLLKQPIHVIYLSTHATALVNHNSQLPIITHPRTLVVAGDNSRLTVIEHYVSLSGGTRLTEANGGLTFTNAVTEITAGAGSIVDYVRVQQESDDAAHIATVQTHQESDSQVGMHTITIGGKLVRNDVNTILAGEGAEVAMNGLYLVKGRQHVDNHTRIDHAAPNCTSTENYRGIMDDRGHGIFNGRIVVHPKAQKTNATQSNRNMMLSDTAMVNTDPQLEIYADDVKCTHGSTVGQIDEETMFYFLSRGIDRETARRLLIHGFTQEIISRIEADSVRMSVDKLVSQWLPDGQDSINVS